MSIQANETVEVYLNAPYGFGTSGLIVHGIDRENCGNVAVKVWDFSNPAVETTREAAQEEARLLSCCVGCKSVVQMFKSFYDKEQRRFFIVMEALYSTLQDLLFIDPYREVEEELDDPVPFTEKEAAYVLRGCTDALIFLHSRSIIHRDIKSDNLMLGEGFKVRLIDFGEAVESHGKTKGIRGSPGFIAPEVWEGSGGYDAKADIWSLGVTARELLLGTPETNPYGSSKVSLDLPNQFSESARDFVRRCCEIDVEKRPTAAEISKHPFLTLTDPFCPGGILCRLPGLM